MSALDTLVAHLTASGVARVYKAGAVPAHPVEPYVVVSASRLVPDVRTLDGSGTSPRRFVVQVFGKTHDSLTAVEAALVAALDARFVPGLPGDPQVLLEVTSSVYRDPDDSGVLNLTHTYRF